MFQEGHAKVASGVAYALSAIEKIHLLSLESNHSTNTSSMASFDTSALPEAALRVEALLCTHTIAIAMLVFTKDYAKVTAHVTAIFDLVPSTYLFQLISSVTTSGAMLSDGDDDDALDEEMGLLLLSANISSSSPDTSPPPLLSQSQDTKKHQALLRIEAETRHQCAIVNSLLAVGLLLDSCHSLISRCCLTLAQRRARCVLTMQHAALDTALLTGDTSSLCQELLATNHTSDEFCRCFFLSYPSSVTRHSDVCRPLPPSHCIKAFPTTTHHTSHK